MKKKCLILIGAVLVLSTSVMAQTSSRIKGVVFADYAWNLENHNPIAKDLNAFAIRRVYFTFENNLSKNLKMKFRLESAHGKFGSTGKINPFVKLAYLEWKNVIPGHKLYLGIAATNAFKNSESCWAYRAVEKTIMDLNKISSSADMGVSLKGDLGKYLHHWITVNNGTGYGSSEVDKYKKIGYSFWITPQKGLIFEGYFDFEKQDPINGTFKYARNYFQASAYSTMKGFVGYSNKTISCGAEIFRRKNRKSGAADASGYRRVDVIRQGFSIFGSCNTPLRKTRLFARYDCFDPNVKDNVFVSKTKNGVDDEYSLIIAGLDFNPESRVHLIPNIMIKNYSDSNKQNDITVRLTLYYKYDSGKLGRE